MRHSSVPLCLWCRDCGNRARRSMEWVVLMSMRGTWNRGRLNGIIKWTGQRTLRQLERLGLWVGVGSAQLTRDVSILRSLVWGDTRTVEIDVLSVRVNGFGRCGGRGISCSRTWLACEIFRV